MRLLYVLVRTHILGDGLRRVWSNSYIWSDSYPCCGGKFMLDLEISVFFVKIWTVWLTVNEKLLIRKQEPNIVVLSVRKRNFLVNIVTFCECLLSFLSVLYKYLSHLLSFKNLKHQAVLPGKELWSQICTWYPEIQSAMLLITSQTWF